MMQLLFAVQCQFFVLGYESHLADFVDLIGVNGFFFFGSENDSKQMWFVRKVHKVVDRLLPLPFLLSLQLLFYSITFRVNYK